MHTLEAAMAATLLARKPVQPISEVSDAVREGTRALVRLALALVAVAALFVTLDVASRAASPEGGAQAAIEREHDAQGADFRRFSAGGVEPQR